MLQIIEVDDIKKEKLLEIEKLEKDVQLINETMQLLNEIYSGNKISFENINDNIKCTEEEIKESNNKLDNTTNLQKDYIKDAIILTSISLLVINAPIGFMYGINAFIATSTLTVASIWLRK